MTYLLRRFVPARAQRSLRLPHTLHWVWFFRAASIASTTSATPRRHRRRASGPPRKPQNETYWICATAPMKPVSEQKLKLFADENDRADMLGMYANPLIRGFTALMGN
jgi:hypothetical protein